MGHWQSCGQGQRNLPRSGGAPHGPPSPLWPCPHPLLSLRPPPPAKLEWGWRAQAPPPACNGPPKSSPWPVYPPPRPSAQGGGGSMAPHSCLRDCDPHLAPAGGQGLGATLSPGKSHAGTCKEPDAPPALGRVGGVQRAGTVLRAPPPQEGGGSMAPHSCPGSRVRLQLPGGLGEAGPQGEEEGQGPGLPGWGAEGRQLWAGIVVDINRAQLGGGEGGRPGLEGRSGD